MKNGGAAFPGEKNERFGQANDCNEGMTLRDYFAVRAPVNIPYWFKHRRPEATYPPMPDVKELDEAHRKTAEDWIEDPAFDLPEEIFFFGEKVTAHRAGHAEWLDTDRDARYFQWRFYYADSMLAEREKER